MQKQQKKSYTTINIESLKKSIKSRGFFGTNQGQEHVFLGKVVTSIQHPEIRETLSVHKHFLVTPHGGDLYYCTILT